MARLFRCCESIAILGDPACPARKFPMRRRYVPETTLIFKQFQISSVAPVEKLNVFFISSKEITRVAVSVVFPMGFTPERDSSELFLPRNKVLSRTVKTIGKLSVKLKMLVVLLSQYSRWCYGEIDCCRIDKKRCSHSTHDHKCGRDPHCISEGGHISRSAAGRVRGRKAEELQTLYLEMEISCLNQKD